MANLINYVKKYGDKSFLEEEFNELDNLVFSLISYINFTDILDEDMTIGDAGNIYLEKHPFLEYLRLGYAEKEGYKLLKEVVNKVRYKDIIMKNYVYVTSKDVQFGAVTFLVTNNLKYIAFEGTDGLISGWKEDFQMAYFYPVPAQVYASNYLNKNISIFDKNVIVGGHSKGGNLALVSSMNQNFIKRSKIKTIYSNDGQGLRYNEINSKKYLRIKDKLIHFVPDTCFVGVLFRSNVFNPIKSNRKDVLAHAILSWQVDDKKLVRSELTTQSLNLQKSLLKWLDNHDDEKRKKMVLGIFNVLEENNIEKLSDLRNIKKAIKVINNFSKIDEETKKIVVSFLETNLKALMEK